MFIQFKKNFTITKKFVAQKSYEGYRLLGPHVKKRKLSLKKMKRSPDERDTQTQEA